MRCDPDPATKSTVVAAVFLCLLCNPLSFGVASASQGGSGPENAHSTVSAIIPRAVPSAAPAPGSLGVNVYQFRSSEPAAMGIADYGVNQAGFYQYSTNDSLGTATIVSLQTLNSTGDRSMSMQLNVVLAFSNNNTPYVYWVQDVAQLDTGTNRVDFVDNVWNFSSTSAEMDAAGISGSGHVGTVDGIGYYFAFAGSSLAGNGIALSYPATITLLVSTGTNSLSQPFVRFEYEDGFGLTTYDTVTFKVGALTSFSGFVVNGNDYTPRGLFYDSELILGGVGSGWQTADVQSDVRLKLDYWNGHNFQAVPSSFNFGSDTAEGISNVQSLGYFSHDTGSLFAEVTPASGSLSAVFDQSQVGTIDILSSLSSGALYIYNATNLVATPDKYPFVNGEVTVALYPGTYLLRVYQGSSVYDESTVSVVAGQSLHLQTPLSDVQLRMSYSILGGDSGFSAPTLTYVHAGAQLTVPMTTNPIVYYMDPGTPWSTSRSITGLTERWVTTQPTSGVASSFQTIQIAFYHQYLVSFVYAVVGGGVGYSPPSITSAQFGSPQPSILDSPVWADAGSTYQFTEPLAGSTSAERWSSHGATNTITGAATVEATYYHQYSLVASLSIVGGGSPSNPILSATQYGVSGTDAIAAGGQIVWLDAASNWSITNPLTGSTSQERWQTDSSTSGSVDGASSVSFTYYHQYVTAMSYTILGGGTPSVPLASGVQFGKQFSAMLVGQPIFYLDSGSQWAIQGILSQSSPTASPSGERWAASQPVSGFVTGGAKLAVVYRHQFSLSASAGPPTGGSVTNSTGWIDAGASIKLSATAATGWKFEGWAGSGNGAYSGPLSQASIQANGPISETATFYPGLVINAGDNGGVAFSYGSQSGTVPAGTSLTVYAPQGSVISVSANPSSILYQFSRWAPSSTGSSSRSTLTLASPASLRASFSINPLSVGGGIACVSIAAAAVAIFALRRKSSKPKSTTPVWLEPLRKSESRTP